MTRRSGNGDLSRHCEQSVAIHILPIDVGPASCKASQRLNLT
jgi:hypothetical protein